MGSSTKKVMRWRRACGVHPRQTCHLDPDTSWAPVTLTPTCCWARGSSAQNHIEGWQHIYIYVRYYVIDNQVSPVKSGADLVEGTVPTCQQPRLEVTGQKARLFCLGISPKIHFDAVLQGPAGTTQSESRPGRRLERGEARQCLCETQTS